MKDIPAFPIPRHTRHFDDSQGAYTQDDGMSLRDYFAAKAMHGIVASCIDNGFNDDLVAAASYRMADAMMEARNGSQ